MKMLNEWILKLLMMVAAPVKNERGSQTLEWLGIAAVIVIVVGVISQAFYGNTAIGEAVTGKFTDFIEDIGQ